MVGREFKKNDNASFSCDANGVAEWLGIFQKLLQLDGNSGVTMLRRRLSFWFTSANPVAGFICASV